MPQIPLDLMNLYTSTSNLLPTGAQSGEQAAALSRGGSGAEQEQSVDALRDREQDETGASWKTENLQWRRTVNARRPERAQNEGSEGPERL